ncbi:MAG: hypothetical protein Q9O24_08980 [Gammaproteobacteria bacterium]|nr:hypothetical protein [Gammaproteobacteria bacterium]
MAGNGSPVRLSGVKKGVTSTCCGASPSTDRGGAGNSAKDFNSSKESDNVCGDFFSEEFKVFNSCEKGEATPSLFESGENTAPSSKEERAVNATEGVGGIEITMHS